ncbi:hypothetical protein JW824_14605 [bacterium]|nr:hypothetical protein [bacterium]RQV93451.1 MAG: hypothetical protein EH221_09500 [bacterium]
MGHLRIFGILLTASIVLITCEHLEKNIPTTADTTSSHITDGWAYYANGNYEAALDEFIEAKNRDAVNEEAYNGLGWTYAKLHAHDESISHFLLLLSITQSNAMKADIFAGLVMTYGSIQMSTADQDERMEAQTFIINYADSLFDYDANYAFERDDHVNINTIRAVIAQSYFNTQHFLTALEYTDQYLESGLREDLENSGVVESREDTLEAEVVPATWMTGSATLKVVFKAVNGSVMKAQLVDVISINHAVTQVEYAVVDFVQGGNSVTFSGNPLPQEEDRFIIQYEHADDYGTFMYNLLDVISQYL